MGRVGDSWLEHKLKKHPEGCECDECVEIYENRLASEEEEYEEIREYLER